MINPEQEHGRPPPSKTSGPRTSPPFAPGLTVRPSGLGYPCIRLLKDQRPQTQGPRLVDTWGFKGGSPLPPRDSQDLFSLGADLFAPTWTPGFEPDQFELPEPQAPPGLN